MKPSIVLVFLFFLVFYVGFFVSQAVCQDFQMSYGGTGFDSGRSLVPVSDGGYLITGYTSSWGEGGRDVLLLKVDSRGNQQWIKTFGGPGTDIGFDMKAITDDTCIIVGESNSFGASTDVLLLKVTTDGIVLWSKTYGGSYLDRGYSVDLASDGGFIVTSITETSSSSDHDILLLKTDSEGGEEWRKSFGGITREAGHCVQALETGGYAVVGTARNFQASTTDSFLMKTNSMGDQAWYQVFGTRLLEEGYAVRQTEDGGFVMAGMAAWGGMSGGDFYLVRTDSTGSEEWYTKEGDLYLEMAYVLEASPDGGWFLGGTSELSGGGFAQVTKVSSEGSIEWQKRYRSQPFNNFYDIHLSDTGTLVCVGDACPFHSYTTQDVLLVGIESAVSVPALGFEGLIAILLLFGYILYRWTTNYSHQGSEK